MALLRAEEWREKVEQHKIEISSLLEEMAQDVLTFTDELDLQAAQINELSERQDSVNKGRKIDEVSPRQARRKVAHITTLSKQALRFAHSFGLEPEFIEFRKEVTNSSLTVHLSNHPRNDTPPPPTQDDNERILQVLYLDKFAVSDEVHHELRMLCSYLPASHPVKQARKKINELLEYKRLPPRSFEATLVEVILKAVTC